MDCSFCFFLLFLPFPPPPPPFLIPLVYFSFHFLSFPLCSSVSFQQQLFLSWICSYFLDCLFIISLLKNASQMGKKSNLKSQHLGTSSTPWTIVLTMKCCWFSHLIEIKYPLHIIRLLKFVVQSFWTEIEEASYMPLPLFYAVWP